MHSKIHRCTEGLPLQAIQAASGRRREKSEWPTKDRNHENKAGTTRKRSLREAAKTMCLEKAHFLNKRIEKAAELTLQAGAQHGLFEYWHSCFARS